MKKDQINFWVIPGLDRQEQQDSYIHLLKYAIMNVFGFDWETIISKSKIEPLPVARYIFCYLLRESHNRCSLMKVGKMLGNRDHTTIIHAIKNMHKAVRVKDPSVMGYLDSVRSTMNKAEFRQCFKIEDKPDTNPHSQNKPLKSPIIRRREYPVIEDVKKPIERPAANYSNKNHWK